MELLVISETKLKIVLTPEDVEEYAIDLDRAEYGDLETRLALFHLFDDIKARCGFDTKDGRLLVELYPDSHGGCEIFVLKVKTACDSTEGEGTELRYQKALYSFEELGDALSVCRALQQKQYKRGAELWHGDNALWYLVLERKTVPGEKIDDLSFVEEFGKRHTAPGDYILFGEHATPILKENAIVRLSSLK